MSLAAGAVLSGLGVGLNSAVGEVFVVKPQAPLPEWTKSSKSAAEETADLKTAIANVAASLAELGERAGGTSAEIFEALTFLLEDEELFELAESHIADGWTAAAAYGKAVDSFAELLGGDADFDERVKDLQDLSKRVQADIAGIEMALALPEIGRLVLVGEDFSPADTAQFTKAVVGVITLKGGPTSHTAIICRSRSIPAVVSCGAAASLNNGDTVLVDPVGDRVLFGGDESLATKAITYIAINDEPIIPVRANIGTLADAENATSKTEAVGVGLFRTELLYLNSKVVPTVDEQATEYGEAAVADAVRQVWRRQTAAPQGRAAALIQPPRDPLRADRAELWLRRRGMKP